MWRKNLEVVRARGEKPPCIAGGGCSIALMRRGADPVLCANMLSFTSCYSVRGGMAEWLKAAVLKTVVPRGTVGSNPTSSARQWMAVTGLVEFVAECFPTYCLKEGLYGKRN